MNKIKYLVLILMLNNLVLSCKDDDNKTTYIPPKPYSEQYSQEKIQIEEYLNTHYLEGTGTDAVVVKIPEGGSQTPLIQHPDLTYKIVNKHDIEYKLYYIPFNQGVNNKPSTVDSVFVTLKGYKLDGTQFENISNPLWLVLGYGNISTMEGWTQMLPIFKSGNYNTSTSSFENSGSAIMFIPSGLGYYNNPPSGSNVGSYSTLVFTFNLHTINYIDHDSDGIPSYLEVQNIGDDPRDYDTDGDGTPNFIDIDDDNDSKITKFEIKDDNGNTYPFDQIPTCPNGTVKKHLDPNCQ